MNQNHPIPNFLCTTTTHNGCQPRARNNKNNNNGNHNSHLQQLVAVAVEIVLVFQEMQ